MVFIVLNNTHVLFFINIINKKSVVSCGNGKIDFVQNKNCLLSNPPYLCLLVHGIDQVIYLWHRNADSLFTALVVATSLDLSIVPEQH